MKTNSSPPTASSRLSRMTRIVVLLLICTFGFVLSIELIKCGARTLTQWFKPEDATSVRGALGAGWLLACVVLSGSPVAALSLSLLDSGALDPPETFAMVTGSRLGASFVVLLVGFVYDLRSRRESGG